MAELNTNNTAKKLGVSVIIIMILSVCLAVTTFALVYSMVSVDGNIFSTATVKINLNDGKPIIKEDEFIFEPGMTVKKDFFVKSESTADIYYRIYFENVSGGLSEFLQIKICSGDKVLYSGMAKELTRARAKAADDILSPSESRYLTVYFTFPADSGNEAQDLFLSFDLAAEAVQVKNNPNKEFR